MVKAEWGTKRLCQGCGAGFYDMRQNPIVCPKCGERHVPAPVSKPTRSRGSSKAPVAAAKPPAEPVVAATSDDETKIESDEDADVLAADGVETAEDDSDDEDVIEDPSELGEDADDMFEVMDKVETKDET